MTKDNHNTTAGLVFLGYRELDIVRIANRVVNACESLDQGVTGVRILSDRGARVTTRFHDMQVAINNDVPIASLATPAEIYVRITISDGELAAPEGVPAADSMMATVLSTLHWSLSPDFVCWIGDVLLTSGDFILATTQPDEVRPADQYREERAQRRASLPEIDETNEILQKRLDACQPAEEPVASEDLQDLLDAAGVAQAARLEAEQALRAATRNEDIEETAPLRLSTWLLSFAVALFALPVGAALMVFNLLRGENLRLTSQTAALTGTFIALQTYGTTASAMATLQSLIG